jgi:ketosteroid isomerase-like protein
MMVRLSLLVLSLGLWVYPLRAAEDDAALAELGQLERAWNAAHLTGDAAVLEGLCVDAVVITVPGMKVMTKAEAFGALRSGHVKFDRYETTEVAAHVDGDTATVIGRLQRTRRMGERTSIDDWRFTKVYVRRGSTWLVLAFHASPTQK